MIQGIDSMSEGAGIRGAFPLKNKALIWALSLELVYEGGCTSIKTQRFAEGLHDDGCSWYDPLSG